MLASDTLLFCFAIMDNQARRMAAYSGSAVALLAEGHREHRIFGLQGSCTRNTMVQIDKRDEGASAQLADRA
jgi:hypothetical protein